LLITIVGSIFLVSVFILLVKAVNEVLDDVKGEGDEE